MVNGMNGMNEWSALMLRISQVGWTVPIWERRTRSDSMNDTINNDRHEAFLFSLVAWHNHNHNHNVSYVTDSQHAGSLGVSECVSI